MSNNNQKNKSNKDSFNQEIDYMLHVIERQQVFLDGMKRKLKHFRVEALKAKALQESEAEYDAKENDKSLMADYVMDEAGQVQHIRYDWVKEE